MKKLTRSSKNKVFAGVIGGFGEFFDVDPVLLRVIFLFFVLITGLFPGVLAYLIAILIIPPDAGFSRGAHDSRTASSHDETKAD